jgi:antitoxin MazE
MELLKVAKWGNGLAIRLPAKMAKELGLQEGDLVARDILALRKALPKITREEAIAGITAMQRPLPKDWKIDRNGPDMRG